MSKCAQLYYPAREVGAYLDLHQDIEFSVLSGYVGRLGISIRQLNVFKLIFIQCQYKNTSMFQGKRSVSSVLFPDQCQLLGLDLPVLHETSRFAAQWFSFWKRSEKQSYLRYLPGDHGICLECKKWGFSPLGNK